jgi:drug/metabolite transporter (DMT)-like permease
MHPHPLNALYIVFAVLLWAGNAVVGRVASDADVPPIGLNFWRWTTAFIILAPFAARTLYVQRELFKTHWRYWIVFGVITVAGFNSAYYIGLQYTTVVQGTLISSALPIFVLVGARLFLAQPITGKQLAGVALSLAGITIIVSRGEIAVLRDLTLNIGDVWMLVAIFLWAAQTIMIRFLPKGMDLMAFQVACFVAGLAVLAPFYHLETMGGRPMPLTWSAALLVGYASILASVVGFTCWNLGVMKVGAKTAGYLGNLFPVFGAALGILLLGEPFRWFHAAGGIATLSGIVLATMASVPPVAAKR